MNYSRSAPEWFYSANNQPVGPVSAATIEGLVRDGSINLDQLVWHTSWPQWVRVGDALENLGITGYAVPATVPNPPPGAMVESPGNLRPATFTRRASSWTIDMLVAASGLIFTNVVLGGYPPLASTVAVVAFFIYFALLPGRGFDTLGHKATGLSVRTGDGKTPEGGRVYWSRTVLVVLLALPLLAGLAGSVLNLKLGRHGKTWHDAFTGTVVVHGG